MPKQASGANSIDDGGFEYDVCLSFAGEDRGCVEGVAHLLRAARVRVFYDEYERVDLWGKDLQEHLDHVYRKAAKHCVLFISHHYAVKVWTTHERKSAQARAVEDHGDYLLPARFDDTELPGLRPTIGYVDLRETSEAQLAELIQAKLRSTAGDRKRPPVTHDGELGEQRSQREGLDGNLSRREEGNSMNGPPRNAAVAPQTRAPGTQAEDKRESVTLPQTKVEAARLATLSIARLLKLTFPRYEVQAEPTDYSDKVKLRIVDPESDQVLLEFSGIPIRLILAEDSGATRVASLVEETVEACLADDGWEGRSPEQRLRRRANGLAGRYFRLSEPAYEHFGDQFLKALQRSDSSLLRQLHKQASKLATDGWQLENLKRVRIPSGGELFWSAGSQESGRETSITLRFWASQRPAQFSLLFRFRVPLVDASVAMADGKLGELGPPKIVGNEAHLRYGDLPLDPGRILSIQFHSLEPIGIPEISWWFG